MDRCSLYIHIPFCIHRCSYCDFNTYAGLENLMPRYVEALCREITLVGEAAQVLPGGELPGSGLSSGELRESELPGSVLPIHTIFFGGGTPSLLPVESVEAVMRAAAEAFDLLPEAEISLEANPGTVSAAYLKALRSLGINRLSLGMQSARPDELHLLERQHAFEDVVQAVGWARQAGFDNLNLDLIFGLPYQTVEQWSQSLAAAIELEPEHLALYALTLEHGTPMQARVEAGRLPEPDPDTAADMYELASLRLAQAGYEQYEISNWARRVSGRLLSAGHNLQYWRNRPYIGVGAGAHGYAAGVRTANVLSPAAYTERCLEGKVQPFPRTPATASATPIDRQAEIAETMMMGLRLTEEGVSDLEFHRRFGQSLREVFPGEIKRLEGLGLLEWSGERIRLTERARLLGNQVFVDFI